MLVVETSKAMEKRTEGTAATLLDLLGSGLKGQVKSGDSLGVWTFNEALITGKYPLREWSSSDTHAALATSVVEFLQKQKYEKQGLPEKVLPTLSRVISNSHALTIILVSSGSVDVHGTGFDERINANYSQWRTQQQKAKMPFVTLLRARDGVLTACAVAPAPFTVELPPIPPEPAPKIQRAAAPKAAPATVPPLIVRGKKPEPQAPVMTETTKPLTVQSSPVPATARTNGSLPEGTLVVTDSGSNATVALATITPPRTNSLPKPAEPSVSALSAAAPLALNASTPTHSSPEMSVQLSNAVSAAPVRPSTAPPSPAAATETEKAVASQPTPLPPAAPVSRGFPSQILLIGGFALAVISLLAVVVPRLVKGRARQTEQVSLITRSLDRSAQ